MIKTYTLFILFILLFCSQMIWGQDNSAFPLQNDIIKIENTLNEIDTVFYSQTQKHDFSTISIPKSAIGEVGNKYYYYAKRYFNARTGVELTFGYNHKLAKETVDTDGEDYAPYNDRYQLTISWDFMRSALLGRQLAFRRIDVVTDQIKNNMRADSLASLSIANSLAIKSKLAPALKYVLGLRVKLQESLLSLEEKLYESRKIKYIDLASRKETLYSIQSKLRNLPLVSENENINSKNQLPDLDVYRKSISLPDTTLIYRGIINRYPEMKSYSLQQELLKLEQRESTIWRRIRIVPYIRGQYYNYRESDNRVNMDIGFNIQVPIDALDKRYQKVLGCQIDNNKTEQSSQLKIIYKTLDTKYNDLKALNQVWITEFNLLQELQNTIKSSEVAYKEQELSIQQLSASYDDYLAQLVLLYNLIEQREQLLFEIIFK